ncbi:hypothetical protein ASPZODRAFT_133074 [Penicilliopsis zonata CBS 506.65]|uniref:Uncharacterized protein n=1 Tax=Penicilliopsis zonata CBS 506.65 TaxID=1073090 RepID=A0A1L9SFX4_9EURO|nr:hypothetical protein ASPZODRAFT_133074 [Penicilliopsis zonata CBS 506.65]OJJ46089.1 hypothetical protein ASPZODRAFT_133074 [Penicilliopsis zonata CBS 506.65]
MQLLPSKTRGSLQKATKPSVAGLPGPPEFPNATSGLSSCHPRDPNEPGQFLR